MKFYNISITPRIMMNFNTPEVFELNVNLNLNERLLLTSQTIAKFTLAVRRFVKWSAIHWVKKYANLNYISR